MPRIRLPSALALAALALPAGAAAGGAPAPAARVLHDAAVVTDSALTRGARATVHVAVTGARSLRDSRPVAGASVELALAAAPAPAPAPAAAGTPPAAAAPRERALAAGTTDRRGHLTLRFTVPPVAPGPYELVVRTRSPHGQGVTRRAVTVEDRALLHLRTDRGVYEPGQTIRWRVTALGGADAHPLAGEEIELTVRDPRGTSIWRGSQKLPRSGMIAGAVPLGEDLVTGSYRLTARLREIEAREQVVVRDIRLPAFEVSLDRTGAGGAGRDRRFRGRLTARYPYGEPVRGSVVIGTDRERARMRGTLDHRGRLTFELPLTARDARVVAAVTDGAGRTHEASIDLPRAAREVKVALVPESTRLVAGARHWFTVVTTDGAGALVPARVSLTGPDGRRVRRSSPGAVRVALRMPDERGRRRIRAGAVTADGAMDTAEVSVSLAERRAFLRPRAAVVAAGEPVVVEGRWPGARGPLLATLLRGGAPIASALAELGPGGEVRAALRPPQGSFGLATVRLVELGWDRARPGAARDGHHATVYLRPATLEVAISGELRHRPGARAHLDVAVRDAAGRPVEGAALAASVVDERVLALSEPRPDLTAALRSFDSVEDAAGLGLVFADLLVAPTGPARDAALRAILEALPPEVTPPSFVVPAEQRYLAERDRIDRAAGAVRPLLVSGGALGRRGRDGRWRYRDELAVWLERAGWKPAERLTPWGAPTGWAYAAELDGKLAFERAAPGLADERLERLATALRRRRAATRALLLRGGSAGLRRLASRGVVPAGLALDPWGRALRVEREGGPLHPLQETVTLALVSVGPDGAFGTRDDRRLDDVYGDLGGTGWGAIGSGHYGGLGAGRGGGFGEIRIGRATATGAAPLRARFDETVLWRVGVPTGPGGTAALEVDLSDSITGWQVAVEAVSPAGAVGAATARLETFLPLHLDAEVPDRLAVGDRYRVPIAVANHSGAAKELAVTAAVGGALRLRGGAQSELGLEHGESGVVYVEVLAHRAGAGTVRLELVAGGRSVDRVLRRITVEPPGDVRRAIHTAELGAAGATLGFTAPRGAAAGSTRAVLRVFRGAADQALGSLEEMLQEPHGCFEQTSSTTYPNLLVLRLLKSAPGMGAVRARARELVGRGYQRLVSYEVDGGGFSWFGDAPANQVLTAYGLMEFVDMAAVYPVDPQLIERTRAWLVARQRPDGSWQPDQEWLHDWSAVQGALSTTAYITWALAESGARGRALGRALRFLRRHRAALERDPYLLALWAAAETAAGARRSPAVDLLDRRAREDGEGRLVVRAGDRTLFHATGQPADAQVTALAAAALHRAGRAGRAGAALDWLWQARSPRYGWGTTQGTVLALRAAALAAPPPPPPEGTLRVALDGREVGAIDLAATGVPSLELAALPPGKHQLTVTGPAGGMRADLRLTWREARPPVRAAGGLEVDLVAPRGAVQIGGRAEMLAIVRNPGREAVAMPTAVIPVPPGFAADPDSLDRLRRAAAIAKVEDLGGSIAVYLTELAPGAEVAMRYALEARAACDVLQRPAAAHAYYSPEVRGQSAPLRLRAGAGGAVKARAARGGAAASSRLARRSPARAVWW
ncbi:MAG TPA: MG2 domain-containing protein [Kofleriaceae bacterium]|nr:MG2 domain-containing protein [Kofleriaceae bacterium]